MLDFFYNVANIHGIIVTVIGSVVASAIIAVAGIIIGKILKRNKFRENIFIASGEQSFCFNEPSYLKDELLEWTNKCNKIIDRIKRGNPIPFSKCHFAILGPEGIGKTLFCQNLFLKLKTEKIFIGWVECNGKQPIYDFIKNNFKGFFGKSKDEILTIVESLPHPLVIFIDQIDQNTNLAEIEALANCNNVTVVMAGLIKDEQIYFIQSKRRIVLKPLNEDNIKIIFENKSKEIIKKANESEVDDIITIISKYVRGNPYLAGHFAAAKKHGYKTWHDVLMSVSSKKYNNSSIDHVTKICNALYKLDKLKNDEKETLTKLSVFSSLKFVNEVFSWNKIPTDCIERLNKTYWLEREDNHLYSMDENHKDVIRKVLGYGKNLKELIISITNYIREWEGMKDKGFEEISYYVEDILKNIKGYAPEIMNERKIIDLFAYTIASQYHFSLGNSKKALEWLGYCRPIQFEIIFPEEITNNNSIMHDTSIADLPKSPNALIFNKARLELFIKMDMLNDPFEYEEIEQAYLDALSIAERFDDGIKKQKNLTLNYFVILNHIGKHEEIKKYCKEYFDSPCFSFDNDDNCHLFYRYLCAAINSNDTKLLNTLATDEIISELWKNNECSTIIAWTYGELYRIFLERDDSVRLELCKKRMVILINRERCFWHDDVKKYFNSSKEEFMEYIHSDEELEASLEEALEREDADAFYLEGRYQEAHGNYEEASVLYEKSMDKDNLKGICSLGQMYYKGRGKTQNYDKAFEYWKYAAERGHKGSFYWLGILLFDENYDGHNFVNELKEKNLSKEELAFNYINDAAKMGSKRARKLLYSLDYGLLDIYQKLFKANPEKFLPSLEGFLNKLVELKTGTKAENILIEKLEIIRRLTDDVSELDLSKLTILLNTLANLQVDNGHPEEAGLNQNS